MKIGQYSYVQQAIWNAAEENAGIKSPEGQGQNASGAQGRKDSFTAAENIGRTGQVWREICSGFPSIRFMLHDEEVDEAEVSALAQQCGKGGFIVVSRDFLDWMAEGEESFLQGREMLARAKQEINRALLDGSDGAGAVLSGNGESFGWTLELAGQEGSMIPGMPQDGEKEDFDPVKKKEEMEMEGVRKMLEKLKEAREKPVIKIKKKINYQVGRDMSKLCRASHDRSIRSFISGVYARRAQIGNNSSYDKKERAAAVAQMDYVIRCARTKIRQVKEEGELKARAEKLKKAKEEKRRLQVERELKERQIKRRAKEHARIFVTPDLPGLRDRDEQREAQQEFEQIVEAAGLSLSPEGAGTGTAAGAATAGALAAAGTATAGTAAGAADMQMATVSVRPLGSL